MVDRKQMSLGALLLFVFLTLYLAFNTDRIASLISANGLQGIFWYVVSDFKNWMILFGVFMIPSASNALKRFSAGVLLAFAADVVSYPRLLTTMPASGEAIRASLDWIVVSALPFDYGLSWYLYYLVLPVVFMIVAFNLLGYRGFLKGVSGK